MRPFAVCRLPFRSDDERDCAIAFLWLHSTETTGELHLLQALPELRVLLGRPATAPTLRQRYGFTDHSLHDLVGVPGGTPTLGHGSVVRLRGSAELSRALRGFTSAQLLRRDALPALVPPRPGRPTKHAQRATELPQKRPSSPASVDRGDRGQQFVVIDVSLMRHRGIHKSV